ncbi:hypothetical protein PHYSODRAFT_318756 [Phytophthora sojae]|uniref:Uncharacterized protein n=1 Tax=Phytophthora sojae (strain P6497) TaxID=1094619 RepID=G5A6D0_PHYSP|nr:hypothetical protein PHYSODRAFT_318756 [Phytophthora sojae]EGZ08885.1 hypothetical protein PHYSODRAFT_318756 [Phytophthora sojae]|eukprot:XP_009535518.1 hypothetical protein PHYSODRAFT_318756 [Phytophthora sojae]
MCLTKCYSTGRCVMWKVILKTKAALFQKAIGAANTPYEDRVALVEKKYYVAGGRARMMFAVKTSRAMASLDRALMAVGSLKSFAEFDTGVLSGTQQRIVSSYAVRELSIKLGPDKFLEAVSLLQMNPSMDGFIFEGWVIGCLAHGPLTLKQLASGGNVEWKQYPLVHFDITQLQLKLQALSTKQWLVPFKWNQSGYGIVFLDKTRGVVRFVQVTRASKHSFAAKAFCDFLNILHACKWMEILSVELCYVVPRKTDEPKPKPFISKEELYRQVIAVVFLQGEYRPFEEKKLTRKTLETTEGTPITCSVDTLEAAYDAISCHDMELQRQEMHG